MAKYILPDFQKVEKLGIKARELVFYKGTIFLNTSSDSCKSVLQHQIVTTNVVIKH